MTQQDKGNEESLISLFNQEYVSIHAQAKTKESAYCPCTQECGSQMVVYRCTANVTICMLLLTSKNLWSHCNNSNAWIPKRIDMLTKEIYSEKEYAAWHEKLQLMSAVIHYWLSKMLTHRSRNSPWLTSQSPNLAHPYY